MNQIPIDCPNCNQKYLMEWKEVHRSAVHHYCCAGCATDLQVHGSLPILVHRLTSIGDWDFLDTIGSPEFETLG
jgi:DNA-directed RNA polymerase subunit RPC12/RpoP